MSDSDFSDAGEDLEPQNETNGDPPIRVNKNGVKVRGPDKAWIETYKFANAADYKKSEIASKIESEFSCRKNREYDYGDVLEYECKFKRRVGFKPCSWKMKVTFLSHNSEVTVESLEDFTDHVHDEDMENVNNPSSNYRWTAEMNKIVIEGVTNHAKPNVV